MVSDWRERSNKRRDERQAKGDVRSPSGSKRDTKRWCRGKVGVKHKPVCVDYSEHKNTGGSAYSREWKLLVCSACRKELDHWWPSPFWKSKKPDWVR